MICSLQFRRNKRRLGRHFSSSTSLSSVSKTLLIYGQMAGFIQMHHKATMTIFLTRFFSISVTSPNSTSSA
ncbi:hypothetical protein SLEP1_g53627 [Rubroshorea leprosula]|uniref:Uncharacterized protein n=1 Tax=Rubroshorea leprosula TaxID=152421 RepID=A0AAV5MA22_9ROSI|nr:hypothetical protein SLEP1_g53627 [Rubroshorea leprosula]